MNFDEDSIGGQLKWMGFKEGANDVWRMQHNGVTYGVDFPKQEIFKFVNGERIPDDPDDEFLQQVIQMAKLAGSTNNNKISNDDEDERRDSDDATDQSSNQEVPSEENNETIPNKTTGLLDMIYDYVGYDVLEVFGDTGSGKSKFALKVAQDAIAAGKSVFYLDTERNLTEADIASLKGCQYKYTPLLEEVDQICQKLPAVDVVILDSIGFPVLTTFARMSVKQKGDSLLKLIAIFGDLKAWAYKNNGVAVVTNQPESEFNKGPNHVLRPFGDKSQFAAKEIWKTELSKREPNMTRSKISAFRSRSVGHKTKIAEMDISSNGVVVKGDDV